MLVVVLTVVNQLSTHSTMQGSQGPVKVSYSEFMAQVKQHHVTKVTIDGHNLTGDHR